MQESSVYRSTYAEATTKARTERNQEIALNALQRGLSIELAADLTGLSLQEVQQLQDHST